MKTAIIVLNYNSDKETEEYVNKIKNFKILDKIIVVDNMSTTIGAYENLKKLENQKIAVIQSEKNGGYSYGNNYGVHYLENTGENYDNIIISNADIDIEENAIKKCIEVLNSEKDIGVVAPRMYNIEKKPARRSSWKKRTPYLDMINSTRILEMLFLKKLYAGEYSEEEYENEKLQVEAIAGSFFVIKYEVLKKINYLDENVFLFYEEDILAHKLKEYNYKVYSLNDIKFIHYESQTIKKSFNYFKKMNQLYKSKMYYQKQYNKIGIFQIILFKFLHIIRFFELLIEVPIRKILKK
ncbi:MAG: glycosyltransferase family 2 protein [Clostridia bacterium]|nr:glycosyltransferase family 2 protein [Clostridia bacterium]